MILSFAGENLSSLSANITVVWRVMYAGVTLRGSENAFMDKLLSGGGMGSMLNTIWLIICAMTFGSIMEKTGLLQKLVSSLAGFTHTTGSLISTTIVTAFGTNCIAADQYIAIVMPGRMYKQVYNDQGLAPQNLSRSLSENRTRAEGKLV